MTAPRRTYTTGLGWTPSFRVNHGSTDITSNFEDRLLSIQVTSIDGGGDSDRVTITLDDRDFQIASPSTEETSPTILEIFLGYKETALYSMGTFQANETTYSGMPRTITILGSSFGYTNAGKAPLIISHDGMTLGDIIAQIAQSAGVTSNVTADLAGQVIPYLNQHSSSLHLLQELERRYNGLAKFSNGKLSFTSRGTGENVSGESIGNFVLDPEDLAAWTVTESSRSSYSKVRASWWNKNTHELQWVESKVAAANDSSVPFMLKKGFNSQSEAQAAADSMMGKLNRGQRQGTLTLAKGDPSIRGGQGFAIENMRDGVNGSYTITTAVHTLDKENGLQTVLEFEDPGTGVDFSSNALSAGDTPELESFDL